MKLVKVNIRRTVEIFTVLALVTNAREVMKTPDFKKFGIGMNCLKLAVETDKQFIEMVGDTAPYASAAGGYLRKALPADYYYWTPYRRWAFACLFTKKVVNAGWFPGSEYPRMQELVQELFNLSSNYSTDVEDHIVQAVFDKVMSNGFYSRRR